MKNIDIGQTIQTLANIGVLFSIIFLAIEIAQNSATIEEGNVLNQISFNESLYDNNSRFRYLIAENEEIARLWVDGLAGKELDSVEAVRFDSLCRDYLWREAVDFNRQSLLNREDGQHRVVDRVRRLLANNPGMQECWNRGDRRDDWVGLRNAYEAN